jgi:hypothetical protein
MALTALGGDPCLKLNSGTSGFPTLWIPSTTPTSDDSVFSNIVAAGTSRSFMEVLNTIPAGNRTGRSLLTAPNDTASSQFRLLQFMSGGGVGAVGTSLDSFLLKTSSGAIQTIIDTYIVGASPGLGKSSYTFGNQITDPEIDTIRTSLITAGYLLSEGEIYQPEQLTVTDTSTVETGSASLLFLSKLEQTGSITAEQTARKTRLESKNLRFYSAFLAEYCFYRTRYQWLLKKYFDLYNTPSYTSPTQSATSGPTLLFTGIGNGFNQYATPFLSQADYLKGLAYHMAVMNTRLTDLRRLLSSINTYYSGIFTRIQNTINSSGVPGSNTDLTKTINALQASANDSKKYLQDAQFKEGVMKYTQEKNRYANILLGLYAFLNVGALAMIYKLK